jgi:hypothetical protein
MMADEGLLFEVTTPLGFTAAVNAKYWDMIVTIKHPVMKGRRQEVQETLKHPDEIRKSKSDPNVYLFYRAGRSGRWICAVVKRLNGAALLVAAHSTDALKEGERIWTS